MRTAKSAVKDIFQKEHNVFAAFSLILILPFIVFGPFSYNPLWDSADSFFSRYVTMANQFWTHGVMYWFPYSSSGVDLSANVVRYFDIHFLLMLVLPDWLVLPLQRFLGQFIAGFFTYKLCRDYLKLDHAPSLLAGLLFLSNQTLAYYHSFSYGFIPLIIWVMERILSEEKYLKGLLYVLLLGVFYALCGSFILDLAYCLPAIFAWFVFARGNFSFKFFSYFLVLCTVIVAIHIPSIWGTFANAGDSHRYGEAAVESSPTFLQLIQNYRVWLLISYLCLIPFSLSGCKKPTGFFNKKIIILLCVCVFIAEFMILFEGNLRSIFPFIPSIIESISLGKFVRSLFFIHGVLLGILVHFALRTDRFHVFWHKAYLTIIACGLIYMPSLYKVYEASIYGWITQGSYVTFFQSARLNDLADKIQSDESGPYRAVLASRVLEPALLNTYGIETAGGYMNIYPKAYLDFWDGLAHPYLKSKQVDSIGVLNRNEHYFYFDPLDEDQESGEVNIDKYYSLSHLSLLNVKYVVSELKLKTQNFKAWSETLPEKAWSRLSTKEKLISNLKDIYKGRDYIIYENSHALPRWYMVYDVNSYQESDDLNQMISDMSPETLGRTVLIHEDDYNKKDYKDFEEGSFQVKKKEYSPETIKLVVETTRDGMLIVANSYNKYWKAFINGEEQTIVPAYGTFWAINILEGQNDVEFIYDPPYK